MSGTEQPADVAARDDAHLRSLGIKPELQPDARVPVELRDRVQLHQRLDRHVRQLRRRAGQAGPAFFWSWPIVIIGPARRGPGLRRTCQPLPGRGLDLPVVQAPVQPDARLVHRLVLLLGPGRDRHRGRGHRGLRRSTGSSQTERLPRLARSDRPDDDVHVHLAGHAGRHDADQRLRRPAPVRRSTTSAWRPRSWAWSCSP